MIARVLRLVAALLILYAAWLMILLSLPYTAFEKYTDFLFTKQLVYHIHHWRISFYVHVFVSTIVLLTGLVQFSPYVLKKHTRLHRRSGIVYTFTIVALSGPTGLVMGYYANGGIYAKTSFMLLALLWIWFTLSAIIKIKKQDWQGHAAMMMRSYALTLSALTLRFYAYMLDVLNVDVHPRTAYIWLAWLSWTVNLVVAEILIRKKIFISRPAA